MSIRNVETKEIRTVSKKKVFDLIEHEAEYRTEIKDNISLIRNITISRDEENRVILVFHYETVTEDIK